MLLAHTRNVVAEQTEIGRHRTTSRTLLQRKPTGRSYVNAGDYFISDLHNQG